MCPSYWAAQRISCQSPFSGSQSAVTITRYLNSLLLGLRTERIQGHGAEKEAQARFEEGSHRMQNLQARHQTLLSPTERN
jgi:hypothetical protein